MNPDGKSAYVANGSDNSIRQYDIAAVTGELSPKTPAAVSTGANPNGVAVSPNGKSAYAANDQSHDVSQYDVDATTGALTPKTPASVGAGTNPRFLAVSSDSLSVYVTNYEIFNPGATQVSQYDAAPLTGALTAKAPPTVAAASHAFGVVVGPLPAAAPPPVKVAFASNRDGNFEIYSMQDDGSGPARLTTNPALDGTPAFSADATRIAFASSRTGTGTSMR